MNTPCHETQLVDIELNPGARKLRGQRGMLLPDVLAAHNYILRSDCGGRGRCGKCRVRVDDVSGETKEVCGCLLKLEPGMRITIDDTRLMRFSSLKKPPVVLPERPVFSGIPPAETNQADGRFGVAVDLGTTTVAVYLVDKLKCSVSSSVALKNPQATRGDDVMSRISRILENPAELTVLQDLAVAAVNTGIAKLIELSGIEAGESQPAELLVVGNSTMVQLLLGIDPSCIGTAPYRPAFTEPQQVPAARLNLQPEQMKVRSMAQVSGFLGGDILAAVLGAGLLEAAPGTLLIDLGTNGELVLKGGDGYYATSCATGPAFEGAALSCGVQAIPGAVNRIYLDSGKLCWSVVEAPEEKTPSSPCGICGSGMISGLAAMLRAGMVAADGRLCSHDPDSRKRLTVVPANESQDGRAISIHQQDIRAVQLGKAALRAGIDILLESAGLSEPSRILVAGGFGVFLDAGDMIRLGMVPELSPEKIVPMGNSAGAGAIMALCQPELIDQMADFGKRLRVQELATNGDFQNRFIQHLGFPAR